ncbi:topoisomerase DNA-binding C4 zinc finger domain-containing protein [Pasteurellaceae bacterium 22721_9_1]
MKEQLFHYKKQQENCPQCGASLVIKQGKKGLFLGCSTFPDCDYLKPLQPHHESKVLKELQEVCPECGNLLQVKQGHFGIFIGCSAYPDCHFIVQDEVEQSGDQQFMCPECQEGELVARQGRQGKTFYACNRFPQCKFTLPSQPYKICCEKCGGNLASLKKSTATHLLLVCANKACKHQFEIAK